MKIEVIRRYCSPTYTIGSMMLDGVYFCDTLEDKNRELDSTMSLEEIKEIKVKGETAVPYGTYKVTLNVKSPKYSNFNKYKYVAFTKGYIPRLIDVPGFEGILIHAGNKDKDTDGCILVGENKVKGQVINSQNTWVKLYKLMQQAIAQGEDINITIKKA